MVCEMVCEMEGEREGERDGKRDREKRERLERAATTHLFPQRDRDLLPTARADAVLGNVPTVAPEH